MTTQTTKDFRDGLATAYRAARSHLRYLLTDLTPELHLRANIKYGIRQLLLILTGVITMSLIILLTIHQH